MSFSKVLNRAAGRTVDVKFGEDAVVKVRLRPLNTPTLTQLGPELEKLTAAADTGNIAVQLPTAVSLILAVVDGWDAKDDDDNDVELNRELLESLEVTDLTPLIEAVVTAVSPGNS